MFVYKQLALNNILLEKYPFPSELVMEAFIVENPNVLKLNEDDFSEPQVIEQQKALHKAGIGTSKDGRVDLIVRYNAGYTAIVELKNGKIEKNHVKQLCKYLGKRDQVEFAKEVFEDFEKRSKSPVITNQKWFGILVGTDIDVDLRCKIAKGEINLCEDENIFITAILLNRYKNDCQNVFISADILFEPSNSGSRNNLKFTIGEVTLAKSRFILYIIQEFVGQNPGIKLSDLKTAFPDWLQDPKNTHSTMGVVQTIRLANTISTPPPKGKYKRYFYDKTDVIHFTDGTEAVVCNQWGIDNIRPFIKYLNSSVFKKHKGNFSITFSFGGKTYTI